MTVAKVFFAITTFIATDVRGWTGDVLLRTITRGVR